MLKPKAVYPLLALVVLTLGLNWPLMSTALRDISPIWMATLRLLGAAITLSLFALVTGRLSRPPRQDYPILLSVAVFRLALMFILVFTALQIVPPGRSSILAWTAALWTVPIAVVFIGERMNGLRWAGLATGIVGILFVFDPLRIDWTDQRMIAGHAMLLVAAVMGASVSVHVRHHRWTSSPLALLPWQVLAASIPMLALALILEGIPSISWTPQLVAIVVYQGALASGFAIWGQLTVLRGHPAISTNLAMMAVPVIGLLSSVVLVDEQLTAAVVVGLTLIVAGVGLGRMSDVGERSF